MSDLVQLVEGHYGLFVVLASALALALILLYVAAFLQGREISFWPPKIGPRPEKVSTLTPAVTLVPPPARSDVVETAHLAPPDYRPFEFVKDIRVVDLRTRLPVPEEKADERHSPVTWIRYTLVRKIQTAEKLSFQFATTGVGLDPRCLTHFYSLRKAMEADVHGERRLGENWEIEVDVSDIPLNQEFLVINEVTYWNAFGGEEGDWASTKVEQDAKEIGLLLLFPQNKPYKSYELYAYAHGSEKRKLFAGESTIFPSKNHMTLYWKVTNPRKDYAYEIEWSW